MGGAAVEVTAFGDGSSPNVRVADDGTFSAYPMWPGSYWLTFAGRERQRTSKASFPTASTTATARCLVSRCRARGPGRRHGRRRGRSHGHPCPSCRRSAAPSRMPPAPFPARVSASASPTSGAEPRRSTAPATTRSSTSRTARTRSAQVPPGHVIVWHGATGSVTSEASSTPVIVAGSSVTRGEPAPADRRLDQRHRPRRGWPASRGRRRVRLRARSRDRRVRPGRMPSRTRRAASRCTASRTATTTSARAVPRAPGWARCTGRSPARRRTSPRR